MGAIYLNRAELDLRTDPGDHFVEHRLERWLRLEAEDALRLRHVGLADLHVVRIGRVADVAERLVGGDLLPDHLGELQDRVAVRRRDVEVFVARRRALHYTVASTLK